MGKASKTTGDKSALAPTLGQTEKTNDQKFQELYDAAEGLRKRLATSPGRLYGRMVLEIPYEASTVQQIVVTDKRIQR
jgi:hypothetical protein